MNIAIDTEEKTITLQEDVNVKELFDFLMKLGINMKEYSLVATEITFEFPQANPTPVPYYPVSPYSPIYPSPTITPQPYNPNPFWYTTYGI